MVHWIEGTQQKLRSQRGRLPATCAASLLLIGAFVHGSSTQAAFQGAKSAAATTSAQPAYACSVNYSSMIASTPGLLNYWRLGEASGTTAVDQTGTTNGTYVGAPAQGGAGAKPSAMGADTSVSFNGVNQSVNAGNINNFAGNAPFTAEGWVMRSPASYRQRHRWTGR